MNHRHFSDFTENIVVVGISYRLLHVQYNTITLFKEGSAITCYSFLTYRPRIIILQSGEAVFVYNQDRGFSSFTDNMKRLSAN